jgi:hypothetical protein
MSLDITSPPSRKTFLDLPSEVRYHIYEGVLVNEAPYILPDDQYDGNIDHLEWDKSSHPVHCYPLGLYKPFSYQNALGAWACSLRDGAEFKQSIARHTIPALWHVSQQVRAESMSLYVQDKLYVGLEGMTQCFNALSKFSDILPNETIRGIRKLYVGVRADVKSRKHVPSEFAQQESVPEEVVDDPTVLWERETGKDEITGIWPLVDMSQNGLPAFQLSVCENILQAKAHYALIPDHSTRIHQRIQYYNGKRISGENLLHIAAWLRYQDTEDAYALGGWIDDRFKWQFEAEGHEVVFHEREMLTGQFRDPKQCELSN